MSLDQLGKLLVCETPAVRAGWSDTLVGRKIVDTAGESADRRQVSLALTAEGTRLAADPEGRGRAVWRNRQRLGTEGIATITQQLQGLVAGTPSGDAIARRKATTKPFEDRVAAAKRVRQTDALMDMNGMNIAVIQVSRPQDSI